MWMSVPCPACSSPSALKAVKTPSVLTDVSVWLDLPFRLIKPLVFVSSSLCLAQHWYCVSGLASVWKLFWVVHFTLTADAPCEAECGGGVCNVDGGIRNCACYAGYFKYEGSLNECNGRFWNWQLLRTEVPCMASLRGIFLARQTFSCETCCQWVPIWLGLLCLSVQMWTSVPKIPTCVTPVSRLTART